MSGTPQEAIDCLCDALVRRMDEQNAAINRLADATEDVVTMIAYASEDTHGLDKLLRTRSEREA